MRYGVSSRRVIGASLLLGRPASSAAAFSSATADGWFLSGGGGGFGGGGAASSTSRLRPATTTAASGAGRRLGHDRSLSLSDLKRIAGRAPANAEAPLADESCDSSPSKASLSRRPRKRMLWGPGSMVADPFAFPASAAHQPSAALSIAPGAAGEAEMLAAAAAAAAAAASGPAEGLPPGVQQLQFRGGGLAPDSSTGQSTAGGSSPLFSPTAKRANSKQSSAAPESSELAAGPSDFRAAGQRRDKKSQSNPFVEYEDREKKLQCERRWLQEDAEYMTLRVRGLKHNTVQDRLVRQACSTGALALDRPDADAEPKVPPKGAASARKASPPLQAPVPVAEAGGKNSRKALRGELSALKSMQKEMRESVQLMQRTLGIADPISAAVGRTRPRGSTQSSGSLG